MGASAIVVSLEAGGVAHDAVDVGNPVKIGGKASSLLPTAASANGDRVNAAFDLEGRQRVKNYRQELETDISAINSLYDDGTSGIDADTTPNNSADVDIRGYRTGTIMMSIAKANAPTYIEFRLMAKDGSNYFQVLNGFLGNLRFSDDNVGTSGLDIALKFPLPDCETIRISVQTSGTTSSATFTVTNATLYLGT